MVLSILMTLLGGALILAGIIGSIVPVIPGPPVAYAGIFALIIAGGWELYPVWLLIVLGAAAVAAAILDSVLPAAGGKRAGAGKPGVWGSVIGMLVGTFVIPPFGTIIGAFAGALVGEAAFGSGDVSPWRAARGVFSGTMLATLVKITVSGVIGFFFIKGAIRLFS